MLRCAARTAMRATESADLKVPQRNRARLCLPSRGEGCISQRCMRCKLGEGCGESAHTFKPIVCKTKPELVRPTLTSSPAGMNITCREPSRKPA